MPLALVAMTPPDYDAWLRIIVPEYAADKVAAGAWPEAEAVERSRRSIAALLPQGRETPAHFLHTLRDTGRGATVGYLWFAPADGRAYLYDLYVLPPLRRRGYGRQALRCLEDAAAALGLGAIALHVFAHNPAALALYRSLGYEITDLNLRKVLAPAR